MPEVDIGAFGNVAGDARAISLRLSFLRLARSAGIGCLLTRRRRGRSSTRTIRCTKMPGVTMASGSSAPSSTISLTSAIVILAAIAITGPKLRAVLR